MHAPGLPAARLRLRISIIHFGCSVSVDNFQELRKPVAWFSPRPMRLSVLTAALQELTPRAKRDADPDLAIEEWLDFSHQIDCPYIQLSAALHPDDSDIPAAAML